MKVNELKKVGLLIKNNDYSSCVKAYLESLGYIYFDINYENESKNKQIDIVILDYYYINKTKEEDINKYCENIILIVPETVLQILEKKSDLPSNISYISDANLNIQSIKKATEK